MCSVSDPPHQELNRGPELQACGQRLLRAARHLGNTPRQRGPDPGGAARRHRRPQGHRRSDADAEHEGDETTHEIAKRVNSTFVTPFDREDIYRLASGLDDVMDYMEEAVDLVVLYEVDELPTEIAEQVDVLQRARS